MGNRHHLFHRPFASPFNKGVEKVVHHRARKYGTTKFGGLIMGLYNK